ncbi:flagellar export chaperone FliS [Marinomonas mediterranea]|jgi:flagellar biosynthetic protein FliS|uniref:Flagellar secretion chaperone FliS n=1 Tax=Marinomonas mediterranea (strain ATCC 700492 / JCM 21426 / NBRC 103028 / MMB-1) TaxID=717774 RepID=F2K4S5_MARM1|nr:flagellar export chaperone FliS [Marinomonas mediterranea]ADZ92568.1 flagellar protein FliS [Marinomonas mediterranea MMB-1]WCN10512.1 flagellar export chaperone FliS [Marinomonas mediterranea]WCN14562.1 flagellar export chaperone FliS [Marinomonas mediterranea]WCN18611.1 flagellar export chaperone FliS [Marinomonas mediterranea MMB-1]
MYGNKGIQAYKKDSLKADLASADPHRIIQLLMQGALERLALAKGFMERKDLENKSTTLTRVVEIINALRDSLDRDANPELVDNLDGLYEFMILQIHEASVSLDISKIDLVMKLMLEIKGAWDQISQADKDEAYAQQAMSE